MIMPSIHNSSMYDVTFEAGTSTLATSTGQYKAVYVNGDNSVAPINTITNYSKFIGITQNYASASGNGITVRTGGFSKAILGAASITAGVPVKLVVDTSTNYGNVQGGDIKAGDTPTAGASLILGKAIVGSQAGIASVCEVFIAPQVATNITTTVAN